MLDAVSCALRREDSIALPALPRMADLVLTITAAEPALGWPDGTFRAIYGDNRQTNIEVMLDGNALPEALSKLKPLPWRGTCDELLTAIRTDWNKDRLPKTPKGLSTALRRLVTPLRHIGLVVTLPKGQERAGALRGKRIVTIAKAEQLPFEDAEGAIRNSEAA